jgi:predicted kinase
MPLSFNIMLVGLPCSGKSTFRKLFQEESLRRGITPDTLTIISADDALFELRDTLNKQNLSATPLTYLSLFQDQYVQMRSEKFNHLNTVLSQAQKEAKIVIIDRTNLKKALRRSIQDLIAPNPIHLVYFKTTNFSAWEERLARRNEQDEKIVPLKVAEDFRKNAEEPTLAEGFSSITTCCPIGEEGWHEEFKNAIAVLLDTYELQVEQKHAATTP